MIEHLEKMIIEEFADRYELRGRKLSFLKYNTPLSGMGLGNKIIFFVFLEGADRPFLIAKTVRSYGDADIIRKGYANACSLNDCMKDSPFFAMFPETLALHDDGYEIWSTETVCGGHRAGAHDLERVVAVYGALSEYIKKSSSVTMTVDADYCKNILRQFNGSAETIRGLQEHIAALWRDEKLTLPRLPQHGDLTIDNVFVNNGDIGIIDCELFGEITLPGFDIFHLLARSVASHGRSFKLAEYLQRINIDIVPDEKLLFTYFLQGMLAKKDYILVGRTATEIISQFKVLFRNWGE